VREFALHGASIGWIARTRDGLEGARREVEVAGGRALVLPTDVAKSEQVEVAAAAVKRQFGSIDVWVNNAMVSVLSPAIHMTAEKFHRRHLSRVRIRHPGFAWRRNRPIGAGSIGRQALTRPERSRHEEDSCIKVRLMP
jgi:Short-chain dehydrogenases of various substrate specificities